MPSTEREPVLRFWTRDGMLEHIRAGAARRQHRQRVGLTAVAAFALVATAAGIVTVAGRSPDRPATVAAGGVPAPTTTVVATTTTGSNQPMTIDISYHQVGGPSSRTFTFHVVFDDPDAPFAGPECHTVNWGDGQIVGPPASCGAIALGCATPPGPTALPPKEPGHVQFDETHTFSAPGTYEVYVSGASKGYGLCGEPYASGTSKTVRVVVP